MTGSTLTTAARSAVAMTLAAGLALTAAPAPAEAGSKYTYKYDETAADLYFEDVDEDGTFTIGSLYAYESGRGTGDAYFWVETYQCPEGAHPWDGYEYEDPETGEWYYEPACEWLGFRFGEGQDLAFAVDKKFAGATLSGTLSMVDEMTWEPAGESTVDLTWTGTGDLMSDSHRMRYRDADGTYRDRYSSQHRTASVDGTIGDLTFVAASGFLSSFSSKGGGKTR